MRQGYGAFSIPLSQDLVALVSSEDYLDICRHKWSTFTPKARTIIYAHRKEGRPGTPRRTVLMHRQIMGLSPGDPRQVHHKNGDGLDNRRGNLEIVTPSDNQLQRHKVTGKVQFVGVSKSGGKYRARVTRLQKTIYLGTYSTPEEAGEICREYRDKLLTESQS